MATMQNVDDYLAEILAAIRPLTPRELSLEDADGGVLAEDITAQWPLPPFDNSAMDGYAVRAADLAAATAEHPVTLPVTGEVAAGDTREHQVAPGSCLRIMTGAPMPAGADAVVPVELTDGGIAQVAIRQAARPGDSVRRAGGDARPGDALLAAGIRLGPAALGLLAASGRASVLARPRPRMTVLSTGNELAAPGTPVTRGQIWESNSFMLASAARQAGAVAARQASVPDDPAKVLAVIEDAAGRADLLVTSGGVSMGGEHDVVKAALEKLGTVGFRKVAMQPGMPQGFGMVGAASTPIMTLPGNPVSAYVSFQLFVRPALRALQGKASGHQRTARAVLTAPLRSPRDKRSFLRGVLADDGTEVTPLSGQASHQLAALARANALIVVPEQVVAMQEGDVAEVICLDD
jgi:molybdopterin molybdotransferase